MEELKKYLKEIGYSENDIEELVNECGISGLKPETLLDNIKRNYEFFISFGYSQEEVIKKTKFLHAIYRYSIENIKQKIKFYDSIGLHSLAVKDSKKLMQSTALSYARYMFYKDNGISIDETNYKKLFASQKSFEKQYGIKKEELLTKYDYKKYMESLRMKKDTQQLGKETMEEQKDTQLLDSIEAQQAEQQRGLKNKTQEKN